MPPPVGRYGPSGLGAPYSLQQAHLQSQPPHAQSANSALPPPSLGGHPGFAGNPNTNMNPFTLSGAGIASGMSVAGFAGAADGGGTGLASHAAQMGFARGAQMQQQQLHQGHDGRLALESKAGAVKSRIRDVWKHNLAQEMAVLRQLVDKYPYISMVGVPLFCHRSRDGPLWVGNMKSIDFLEYRTLNSLGSLPARSVRFRPRPITTTRLSDAMSTC